MAKLGLLSLFFTFQSCHEGRKEAQSSEEMQFRSEDLSISGADLDLKNLTDEILKTDTIFEKRKSIGFPTNDNIIPQSRNDLDKMKTVIKIYDGSIDAGVSLASFGGIKLGRKEKSMSVYYLESKVVVNKKDSLVYACGYAFHYLFKKLDSEIQFSNIASVAASAQLKSDKTQVFYSVETFGAIGHVLGKFFKPTVNKPFNVEGFGSMQSSIDGVHNIFTDEELSAKVKFTPEIVRSIKPRDFKR